MLRAVADSTAVGGQYVACHFPLAAGEPIQSPRLTTGRSGGSGDYPIRFLLLTSGSLRRIEDIPIRFLRS